jgi:hypothetical protein
MARMANAVSPMRVTTAPSEFDCHFALVPKDDVAYGHWSIDEEAMGETWHDSSWMLRKGLDVIEDIDLDPPPRAWVGVWRQPAAAELGFPMLRLSELG